MIGIKIKAKVKNGSARITRKLYILGIPILMLSVQQTTFKGNASGKVIIYKDIFGNSNSSIISGGSLSVCLVDTNDNICTNSYIITGGYKISFN